MPIFLQIALPVCKMHYNQHKEVKNELKMRRRERREEKETEGGWVGCGWGRAYPAGKNKCLLTKGIQVRDL